MVSRISQLEDAPANTQAGKAAHLPSKNVVKETQREPNVLVTPTHFKKEGQTLDKAHDVAELKDYVCMAVLKKKDPIANSMPATR